MGASVVVLLPLVCCRTPFSSVSPQTADTALGHTPDAPKTRTTAASVHRTDTIPLLPRMYHKFYILMKIIFIE